MKFQAFGGEKFFRYLPIFAYKSYGPYSCVVWVIFLNYLLMLGILLRFCLRNIKVSILTTQESSRYWDVIIVRERTSEKVAKVSFCISSTKTSQRKKYFLIVSMRQHWKYTNSFSTEPKYQIKLEVSILKTNSSGKTSLAATEHSKLQKPAAIFNAHSKIPKHNADLINIENRWINIMTWNR